MIRRKIYQWHRTLSLIIAIPVILWALSGFLHPIMTTIRPEVAKQTYNAPAIDSSQLKVSLSDALRINNYPEINSFRIIQIKGNHFYQIKLPGEAVLQYISTIDGKLLQNGDDLYARYLARYFLLGDSEFKNSKKFASSLDSKEESEHDCCVIATNDVMSSDNGLMIKKIVFQKEFDTEYKSINRLLPVYKVDFEREDNIRIYVETAHDRLGLAFDNTRSVFDKLFQIFHNMSWLNSLGNARLVVEISIMSLAFITTIMGIFIFFTSKSKIVSDKPITRMRRNHRYISIFASLFTLLFTFSGAFHAFQKFKPDTRNDFFLENKFSASELDINWAKLQQAIQNDFLIVNISAIRINDQTYLQVYQRNAVDSSGSKKSGGIGLDIQNAIYLNADDYSILRNGEEVYARYLASVFKDNSNAKPIEVKQITKFAGEYGFVNKRLPVWKIAYDSNYNERFYVETSSNKLSVRIDDREVFEGLSFSFLHKHHFMDFAGKSWRDFSTMFWAAMQVAMIVVGLILWKKAIKAKKSPSRNS
jgi:hypothetical protein